MCVQVHEAGKQDLPAGIDHLGCRGRIEVHADLEDRAVADEYVGGLTFSVDQDSAEQDTHG
jgi:hypothetical protein